jgi:hypothetical protein
MILMRKLFGMRVSPDGTRFEEMQKEKSLAVVDKLPNGTGL